MPSYRFCRPDDIPLLVHAVETCYRVHDPGEPEWTAESFRRGMREIDLWPSNSMVALDTDGEPLAVMIGTKRAEEVAVHRLGVRPDHLREGHGQHLLTSLSQKLAVLGPERLVAEVPDERPTALACFAAAGYEREATLVDWWRPAGVATDQPVPEGLVSELAIADLDAADLLADTPVTAWCRSRRSLVQSGDRLVAAAVVSPDRIESWIVFASPPDGEAEPSGESGLDRAPDAVAILAAGAVDPERLPLFFGVLVRWLAERDAGRGLFVPRLAPDELAPELLAAHGFTAGGSSARLAATATPL